MENAETEAWLDFANDYQYMVQEKHQLIVSLNNEVGRLLNYMIEHPEKFTHHS